MNDLRSPLAKAKGLGSSGDGTHHFWLQRLTALALIPLTLWFGFSIAMLPVADYAMVVAWLDSPFNITMMILIILVGFQHGQLGMQVILEDYIADRSKRMIAVISIKIISYFMMVLGVVSLLKIIIGGT